MGGLAEQMMTMNKITGEFKVLQRANFLVVLWARVDVLSINHSLLFIKAGALKSPSNLVPVIVSICKE